MRNANVNEHTTKPTRGNKIAPFGGFSVAPRTNHAAIRTNVTTLVIHFSRCDQKSETQSSTSPTTASSGRKHAVPRKTSAQVSRKLRENALGLCSSLDIWRLS